jgi:hypothetical protein
MSPKPKHDVASSRRFVASLDLSDLPSHSRRFAAAEAPAFTGDAAANQSVVVGSDIVSFTIGVSSERREAITNSALLAQLVANKKVPDATQIEAWYEAYFDVLTHLGWVLQERGFSVFETSNQHADVAAAILDVAAALLGGVATTAYKVVQATISGLQKMSEHSPWITLFERESHHANVARFQIALAHSGEKEDFLVSMMAFSLEASMSFNQVLFFKYRQFAGTLKHYSGSVSINDDLLMKIAGDIKAKVESFTFGYVKALPDLS